MTVRNRPFIPGKPQAAAGTRPESGFSLAELLVVVALLGIFAVMGLSGMQEYRRRANVVGAARSVQSYLLRARMLSVYKGTRHFVVIDEPNRKVSLVVDSHDGAAEDGHGVYCDADKVVAHSTWQRGVSITLPNGASSVDDPLDSGAATITEAWTLDAASTDAPSAYSGTDRGMTTTPFGRIEDASDSPDIVGTGVGVFSDDTGQAAAVGIRGAMGMATLYYMPPGSSKWNRL